MSDENDKWDIPTGRFAQLQLSISNLWDEFGQTESIGLALVINLGLAALGMIGYVALSGIPSYIAGVWAVLNLLGIVKWVLGL